MGNADVSIAKRKLILVEDDMELASLIRDFLVRYEFDVSLIGDGIEAVQRIITEQPDIVILDVMLPGQSGMDVCRQVRQEYKGLILMQTALDEDIDQMLGLELGADDYIVKQVNPRLLLSRIRALLRRMDVYSFTPLRSPQKRNNHCISAGDLLIDLGSRSVLLNHREIVLTTAEFELLCLLANSPGEVVSRDDIIQQIRGYEYDGLDRSVDRRISRLRKKLQDDSVGTELIKTIRGKGYQLCL